MIALCKFEHTCFEGTRAPLLYTADEIIISNINLILLSSLNDIDISEYTVEIVVIFSLGIYPL